MADLLTIEQQFGSAKGLPVTLTWAPHIKSLPKAVPNSFLLTAAALGCQLRVAHPRGFELHPEDSSVFDYISHANFFREGGSGASVEIDDGRATAAPR